MNKRLEKIKCFLLDLDGTVYLGKTLIPGTLQAIERMRKSGKKVFFLTNNSSVEKEFYSQKLEAMGIENSIEDFYSSSDSAKRWLKINRPNAKVYFVGTPSLKNEWKEFNLTNAKKADTVVLTFDKTLNYKKIKESCYLIERGAFYLATHPDKTCPSDEGNLPDIGAFIKMIEEATGRVPDIICGKPYSPIAEGFLEREGLLPQETAMIGDRLSTDILFAKNNGMVSILVLSGETTIDMYEKSNIKADIVLKSISEWDK